MNSLKKNELFRSVFKKGKTFANRYLVINVLKNNEGFNRIGIQVSKKVGNSVVRHRLTRLVRESYRLNENKFIGSRKDDEYSVDIVFVLRVNANTVKKCCEIESAMLHGARHLRILRNEK